MNSRYLAQPTNPPRLVDTHKDHATIATFVTFEQAVNRAYILNRFSEGARI